MYQTFFIPILRRWAIAFVALAVCAPLLAGDGTYPNTEWMGGQADKESKWYRHCMQVIDVLPPPDDVPTEQAKAAVSSCVGPDLYYDAKGNPARTQADWDRVRHCAFAGDETGVLMMLYANGFGVQRNMDLAIRYACATGGAPAEMMFRIGHLEQMTNSRTYKDFDICDDITSGYMSGYCTSVAERQNSKARENKLSIMTKDFGPSEKHEFETLRSALAQFAKYRGEVETDMSGTARAAISIRAEAQELSTLVKDMESIAKNSLTPQTRYDVLLLDRDLNQSYRKIMAVKPVVDATGRLGYTTITKDGVRKTERAWLIYRDQWIRFIRIYYPHVDLNSLKGLLTMRRGQQLHELLDDIQE